MRRCSWRWFSSSYRRGSSSRTFPLYVSIRTAFIWAWFGFSYPRAIGARGPPVFRMWSMAKTIIFSDVITWVVKITRIAVEFFFLTLKFIKPRMFMCNCMHFFRTRHLSM